MKARQVAAILGWHSTAMASSSNIALKTFNLTNDVKEINSQDDIFKFDPLENRRINNDKPWVRE